MLRISILLLALLAVTPALAQRNLPPDSLRWQDTKPTASFGLGTMVVAADGRTIRAFLPWRELGYEGTVPYRNSSPEVRPFPEPAFAKVEKLHSMTVRGNYFETMRLPDEAHPQIMARRVVDGPVELFAYVDAKVFPVPLMGVGVAALTGALSGIPDCTWYVRHNNKLERVRRNDFQAQMSTYTQDCLAVKEQILQGAKGFRYGDMPNIVSLYNQHLQEQAAK
ncbi:hypothetical protein [Solirubrum puertoriconensis]|uniref:Uncharacterized protein n=1 Tax=Solirubrum puertoriconensis TaxID=1751427 RepID=A0A9X0L340_SOLP1|nr:hypothetical protein [Solirubrum puertoriconensis]KUG06128.1 hypothetical protein ASU33_01810 [Solirubrum puertoriconensis]